MAPGVGFEPTTNRLTADSSTAELPRNEKWSRHSDSNRGPTHYKCVALPLSYVGKVAAPGLEPDLNAYETFQTTWPSPPRFDFNYCYNFKMALPTGFEPVPPP
jgi:hypothetical protein